MQIYSKYVYMPDRVLNMIPNESRNLAYTTHAYKRCVKRKIPRFDKIRVDKSFVIEAVVERGVLVKFIYWIPDTACPRVYLVLRPSRGGYVVITNWPVIKNDLRVRNLYYVKESDDVSAMV